MAFTLPIPPDTAIITDDAGITGAALLDPTTGVFLGFAPLAQVQATGSESGVVMLDGTIGLVDNSAGAGGGQFGIYDGDLVLITTAQVGPTTNNTLVGVTTDRDTYFYIIGQDASNNLTVYQVDKTGVTTDSWVTGLASALDPNACAVDRANTFFYFTTTSGGIKIRQLNLSTGAVTDLATLSTVPTAILMDTSDNFYVNRDVTGVATIEKYDSSFVLQSSVDGGPSGYSIDRAHLSADDAHLFTWTQKNISGTTTVPVSIGAQFVGAFGPLIADAPGAPVRITVTSIYTLTISEVVVYLTPSTGPTGSVELDILNNGVSIVGASPPTIVAGTSYSDTTLTGWTTAVTSGDDITFVITSTSNARIVQCAIIGDISVPAGNHPDKLSAFRKIRLSDLAVISDVTDVPTESNSNFITEGAEISNSCPMLITAQPLPSAGALIVVEKDVVGGGPTTFDFTATNMSPSSFSLGDGQSQSFIVTAGSGYGVAETAVAGWSTSVSVSDGSPPDNIDVSNGETVTVTFTNSPYSSTTYPIRRERSFVLPHDRALFTFLRRLEILMKSGVGNSDEPNPTITINISRDGGETFGPDIVLDVGVAGDFTKRVFTQKLGKYRIGTCKVSSDDPVFLGLLACYVDIDQGVS